MTEMIKRVAKAMAEDLGYVWDTMPEKAHSTECAGRDFWLGCADAAIQAMREPTESMINAATGDPEGPSSGDVWVAWTRMIDNALGE